MAASLTLNVSQPALTRTVQCVARTIGLELFQQPTRCMEIIIDALGQHHGLVALLMDSAYQDDATRALAQAQGLIPVVPPNPQCKQPWQYDKRMNIAHPER